MGIYRLGLVFAKIRGKQKVLQRFQSVAKISMSLLDHKEYPLGIILSHIGAFLEH